MIGKHFDLTEETLPVVEEIGGHMPGGFFIYKAEEPEEWFDGINPDSVLKGYCF